MIDVDYQGRKEQLNKQLQSLMQAGLARAGSRLGSKRIFLHPALAGLVLLTTGVSRSEVAPLLYSNVMASNLGKECPYGYTPGGPYQGLGQCNRNSNNKEGYSISGQGGSCFRPDMVYAGGGYCMTTNYMRPPQSVNRSAAQSTGGGGDALSNAMSMYADAFGGGRRSAAPRPPQVPEDASLLALYDRTSEGLFSGYSIRPLQFTFSKSQKLIDDAYFANPSHKEVAISEFNEEGESQAPKKLKSAFKVTVKAPSGESYAWVGSCSPSFKRWSLSELQQVPYTAHINQTFVVANADDEASYDEWKKKHINGNGNYSSGNNTEFKRAHRFMILSILTAPDSPCRSEIGKPERMLSFYDEYYSRF